MSKNRWLAVVTAVVLLVPVAIVAMLAGWSPEGLWRDLTRVAIVGLAILIVGHLLFHPRGEAGATLDRLRHRQAEQADRLDDVARILPHLIPESLRALLVSLLNETAGNCQGNPALRGELRRLSAMGLVQPRIGRRIRQIADESAVDLAEYVELTPLGTEWVRCILSIEKAERPPAGRSGEEDRAGDQPE